MATTPLSILAAHEDRAVPPPLPLLAREVVGFASTRIRATFAPPVPLEVDGKGQHVFVIPGFLASDRTTARLRRSLDGAGFRAHGWGLGRNSGVSADLFEQIDRQFDQRGIDHPAALVGWSLGGVIAREYAKRAPHRVSRVISLGSPFSAHPRANNAWRVYEFVAGHKVDNPPVAAVLHEKPPVPTFAFWSAHDGVVAPDAARGRLGEVDHATQLDCSHMAFIADPEAIRAVARAIVA
ncbi:MAG TPA: alpha/beta fold hydrolase [Sphingorhabdus sp.]|jgi:pimeloyl-ACP methyl ester carboxylesterase|uniref:esterase/lipase family protein n=1 Tax=Sphingorhabdus sp. TaxID=1902408 RepID=UPI002C99BB67|nr:alpha/beta fold hydrolase [Sphingorhabdus sp.]HMT41500.1 alpha/beta fold hydrolase [Sphingorhabdus sp.]HMU21157.1 alpha/beta fold hydrolase [Sphingorhabdus sp.]